MTQHKFKTVNVKGKEYVEVNQRIQFFRTAPEFKDWSLETEIISSSNDSVIMRAIARNPEGRMMATGFAQEARTSSMINKTSFVENCETSAWGRCMANLGVGITTEIGVVSIASAEEVQMAIAKQELTAKQPAPEVKADFEQKMGLPISIDDVIENERERVRYSQLLRDYSKAGGKQPLPSSQGLSDERIKAGIDFLTNEIAVLTAKP